MTESGERENFGAAGAHFELNPRRRDRGVRFWYIGATPSGGLGRGVDGVDG